MKLHYFMLANDKGQFMPEIRSQQRGGYTHTMPVNPGSGQSPRLFAKESSAKTALTWWLKGPVEPLWEMDYDHDLFGGAAHHKAGADNPGAVTDQERKLLGIKVVPVQLELNP